MIKWGIIGSNKWTKDFFIPAILNSKNGKLIAIMSRKKDPYFDKFKKVKQYDNIDEFLLNNGIDIVWIVTPDHFHHEHALKCLNSNKHILIEKPMCENVLQCNELKNLADLLNKKIYVGYNNRYNRIHMNVKNLINENFFGDIISVKASFFKKYTFIKNEWKSFDQNYFGWVLSHIATNYIDLFLWLFNSKFKVKYSKVYSPSFNYETEDYCFIILKSKKIIFTIECSTGMNVDYTSKIEIIGTKGFITMYDTLISNGYFKTNKMNQLPIEYIELNKNDNDSYLNQIDFIHKNLISKNINLLKNRDIDQYIENIRIMDKIKNY